MSEFLFLGSPAVLQQLQSSALTPRPAADLAEALALAQSGRFAFALLEQSSPELVQALGETPVYLPTSQSSRFSLEELVELKNKALSHLYHQLQGPVTALEGYLEILSTDQLPPESVSQILSQLSHSVTRLRLYFHSLHLLSLVSPASYTLKPRPFQFHQLMREFARDFEQQMAISDVQWEYQLNAGEDLVLADPHFMLHLFSVLMDLAQRTGLERGRLISLQTGNLSAERLQAFGSMALDPGQSLISFLPPQPAERFLQISLQFRGVGPAFSQALGFALFNDKEAPAERDAEVVLGAYLAERILKASESWLYLEAQPGSGLLFSFVLPLHALPQTL